MQQVLTDYIHPRKFPMVGGAASVVLMGSSALVLFALLKLTFFGGGVTKSVKVLMNL